MGRPGARFFVANYTLTKNPAGDYVSYAVWTKGVPTLLPKTDRVMFIDTSLPESSQSLADAPWSRVTEGLAHRMEDTKMFPARFHVAEFPPAAELAALHEGGAARP